MDLLRCLSSQPQAAAQATAVSLGAYHSVALMAQKQGDLQLYAFGRGEHTRAQFLHIRYAREWLLCLSQACYISSAHGHCTSKPSPVRFFVKAESETDFLWWCRLSWAAGQCKLWRLCCSTKCSGKDGKNFLVRSPPIPTTVRHA